LPQGIVPAFYIPRVAQRAWGERIAEEDDEKLPEEGKLPRTREKSKREGSNKSINKGKQKKRKQEASLGEVNFPRRESPTVSSANVMQSIGPTKSQSVLAPQRA
jgi:hypothetical protein